MKNSQAKREQAEQKQPTPVQKETAQGQPPPDDDLVADGAAGAAVGGIVGGGGGAAIGGIFGLINGTMRDDKSKRKSRW